MVHNSPLLHNECLLQELDDPLALDSSTTSRHPPLQDKNTPKRTSGQIYRNKGGNSNSAKLPKAKAVHSSQNVAETLSLKAPENTNTLLQ